MKIDHDTQTKMLDDNIDSVIEGVITRRLKKTTDDVVDYDVCLKRLELISTMTKLVLKKIKAFEKLYNSGRTFLIRSEVENYIGHIERYYLVCGEYETYMNTRPNDRRFFQVTPELIERVLAVLREELVVLDKKQKEDLYIVETKGTGFDIRRSMLQKKLTRLNKSKEAHM